MGGRGNFGSRNTGSTSQSNLLKTVQDYVTHNLNNSYRTSIVTDAEIVGEVDKDGMANVKVSYEDHVTIAVGYDQETGQMEYERDTEYHTNTFRMKVR